MVMYDPIPCSDAITRIKDSDLLAWCVEDNLGNVFYVHISISQAFDIAVDLCQSAGYLQRLLDAERTGAS